MFLLQADFMSEGVLGIIRNLGPFALAVLLVLGFFSILSWAVIVDRILLYRKAEKQTVKFLEVFRASSKFSQVRTAAKKLVTTPLAGVFDTGYGEISSQLEGTAQSGQPIGSSRMNMGGPRALAYSRGASTASPTGTRYVVPRHHQLRRPLHRPVRHGVGAS